MVGGVLEYMALITGYRALLLLVAILYLLAWMFGARKIGQPVEDTHADPIGGPAAAPTGKGPPGNHFPAPTVWWADRAGGDPMRTLTRTTTDTSDQLGRGGTRTSAQRSLPIGSPI